MQRGWNGKPLYYFVGDRAPGDVEGDGLDGAWHAVHTGAPLARQSVQFAPEVLPWPRF